MTQRSAQLDADELDQAMTNMFGSHLPWSIREKYAPELNVLLSIALRESFVWTKGASYGQSLQNLVYRNTYKDIVLLPLSLSQKVTHLLLGIGVPYVWERSYRTLTSSEHLTNTAKSWIALMKRVEKGFKVLSLLNFIVFLKAGVYPTLVERILRMRLVYDKPNVARFIGLEFMNREIIWQALTDFMMFLVPLLNLTRIRNRINRVFRVKASNGCPICSEDPSIPVSSNCGHVYCYYCLSSNLLADPSLSCFVCDSRIDSFERIDHVG